MANLGRIVEVRLGQAGATGLLYRDLRVSFRVEKQAGGVPNKAEIVLFNVAPGSLRALDGPRPTATLMAGYQDTLAERGAYTPPRVLFAGDVINYQTVRDGTNRVTTLQCMDGGRVWQRGDVSLTFSTPVRLSSVIQRVAIDQGLTLGHVALDPDLEMPHGGHFEGAFHAVMDRLARAGNAEWSVETGVLQVVPIGATVPHQGPFFSPEDGTAFQVAKGEHGQVVVTAPLDGAIRPGVAFFVLAQGDLPAGEFVARQVRHVGDSGFDRTFLTEVVGAPLRRGVA